MNLKIYSIIFIFISWSPLIAAPDHWKPKASLSFVYLTWEKEDTSTHITVNYHSSLNYKKAQVFYDDRPRSGKVSEYRNKTSGKTLTLPSLKRAFHRVTIDNLSPGKKYYFSVGDEKLGFSKEFSFKTIPKNKITFVTGGDMGTSKSVDQLLKVAAQTNPDFVAIGGDIAYGDGSLSNFSRWDEWLEIWTQRMITSDGRLIPMTLAIGNHETKKIKQEQRDRQKSIQYSPFYFSLFEQGLDSKAHFLKYFGNHSVIYYLDTGHINEHSGKQESWLQRKMKKNKNLPHQIAVYHIPLYPSFREYDAAPSQKGRSSWLDLFGKYKLDLAFENHDHTLKVTHPLKNGAITKKNKGTIYLGDGCLGKSPRKPKHKLWYLEEAKARRHFWHVTMDKNKISYKAIGENNEVFYQSNTAKQKNN